MKRTPRWVWAGVLVAAVSAPPVAWAQEADEEAKQRCVDAHVAAQRSRIQGRLVQAKQELLSCASAACPAVLRDECLQWLPEVLAGLPSVRLEASDQDGAPVALTALWVDGEAAPVPMEGMQVALDPGRHLLRALADSGTEAEVLVELHAGETDRVVRFTFPPAVQEPRPSQTATTTPAPVREPPAKADNPASPWLYGLVGVGVASATSFGIFAVRGRMKQKDLETGCAPRCDQQDVDAMRQDYLVADLSLLAGVAAISGAAILHLGSDDSVDLAASPMSVHVRGTF